MFLQENAINGALDDWQYVSDIINHTLINSRRMSRSVKVHFVDFCNFSLNGRGQSGTAVVSCKVTLKPDVLLISLWL